MIFWNSERNQYLNYTKPYLVIRQYIFVHEDNQSIKSMADLDNKIVAVPKGYAHIPWLTTHYPNVQILAVETTLDAIDAVITKQADAVFENTAMIQYMQKKYNVNFPFNSRKNQSNYNACQIA